MTWEPMTIDEYAEFQKKTGAKVVRIDGTWWTEARPFFFRPLFPFAEITPRYDRYPLQALVGGVLHPVPAGAPSNSRMNLFIYDELKEYSLEKMGAKQRWIIRQGLKNFQARRMTDVNAFIDEAYGIYDSFYARTRYFYKKERRNREAFAKWARSIFQFPKVMVLGAYHGERLCAIDISYRVEDVIIEDVFFSDTDSQSLRVTDFVIHTLREAASASDARCLFRGFPSGKKTLDDSKVTRGCRVLKLAAYCKINPLALWVGKAFMNESYRKLLAITSFPESGSEKPAAAQEDSAHPEDSGKLGFLAPQYFKGAGAEHLVRVGQQVANEVHQQRVAVGDVEAKGNVKLT